MKIRQRLILGFMAIALSIGVIGGTAVYYQDRIIENSTLNEIRYIQRKFLAIKERDTKLLSSALEVFLQDQSFKDVFLEKDREKLYTYAQPLFQKLKNNYGITHFYFILPDGRCFVRLHNKDIHGDLITRFTFQKARQTKQISAGIELGKTAFALRVVSPYYNGDELIGYVEFGEGIDHFLEILKGDTHNEFAIVAEKEYLGREKWGSVRLVRGLKDNWDVLESHVIISDTAKGRMAPAIEFEETDLSRIEKGEICLDRIQKDDKTFVSGGIEIIDAGGRHAGMVLSLIDVTENTAIARKAKFVTFSIVIILLIAALGISFSFSRSISGPITKLTNAMVEVSKGRLGTKIDIRTKDEIGVLAGSFNRMSGDLKKSRDELVASKDYTANIIKSMGDILIVIDKEAKIKTINRAACELSGYSEDELIGRPVTAILELAVTVEEEKLNEIDVPALLISKDFRILKTNSAFLREMGIEKRDVIGGFCYKVTHNREDICELPYDTCPIREALRKNKPCVELHTHFNKEGNPVLVNVVAAPVRNGAGDILYYLHLNKKIKEGERKDLIQKETLETARELVDKLQEYLAKPKSSIFTETGLDKLVEIGAAKNIEMFYKASSGEKIPVSFSGSVMKDESDNLVGIVGIARDMREAKRLIQKEKELAAETASAEAERKRAAELDKAYKELQQAKDMLAQAEKLNAIGQLASGIAHEVKNPLGIIMQSVNYLEEELPPGQKDVFEILDMIKDNVERSDKIIRSLLDFSRVTKLTLQPEDINSILRNSLTLIEHEIRSGNIEVVDEMKRDIPQVLVDKTRLEQVFVNIFLNALQAMSKGGKITIRTYSTKLKGVGNGVGKREADLFRPEEQAVIVEIEDTGSGISSENLKRIFDPFFTTKPPGKGTGLGLSVTRNIINMHRGLIDMKSHLNKGTTAVIILKISGGQENGKNESISC